MKVLLDTNVILDVLGRRKGFYEDSFLALNISCPAHVPCVSTITVTDTAYLSRKFFKNSQEQKNILAEFFSDFKILPVTGWTIRQAFASSMDDFEDAVQAFCARKAGAKLIITRNVKDFSLSPVPALSPADFAKSAP